MGVLQMAESEHSGNTISKGQEKPRKTSTESSQSPKAARPSCLRGAFFRIFLKRAEPNNRTEEDPTSIQNTVDQEGVRGKKRRVTGSIFRLPCLRPAETTGNDLQDKTEEQSNDIVQEEELKPYSKASFLRKIRCYRLMREKDATEKEKVIEMTQRKHDRENTEVRQYKERVLEQSEEGLQRINHDKVVERKGKDITKLECHAENLREASNDFQEQDFKVDHVGEQENGLRKQECCKEKSSGTGEESMKIEDPAQGLGGMGKDLAEQENCVESVLLDGEVSLLDDKNLVKQESQVGKLEQKEHVLVGVREQEKDMPEQKNYAEKVGDLDNALSDDVSQPEEVGMQEKHLSNKEVEAMEKDVPKQESHSIVITNTEQPVGVMPKYFPGNKCHTDEMGNAKNYLSEQEGHTEKVENTENNLSRQQHLEEDMEDTRNCLSEQDGQKEMKGLEEKNMSERDSQGDITEKLENNESHVEGHVGIGGDQEDNLVDQDSQVENTRKGISQQSSQYIVKDTQAETLGEFEDNTMEVSGVSLGVPDEQHFTNNMSNQRLTMSNLKEESLISDTCQSLDSSAKRTLSSGDNEELLASVSKKTAANNIITCTSSEEADTQVLGLEKEVLTSTKVMDLRDQEPHILHTCVNNEDDGNGCESPDLGSLREEVKDMVEWMVQEASDRLSNYAQESEGTG